MTQSKDEILSKLRALSDPAAVKGMTRFGINTKKTYGVSVPHLRSVAKEIGSNHALARQLWSSRIHEAKILATMIDDPRLVEEDQMEEWVAGFDSWDVCDQCCGNLFDKTKLAYLKAVEWTGRDEEFVKRAGFALMATLAVHDKKADDREFMEFLSIIEKHPVDERNFVKKAVNWAIRQIGKRNLSLNEAAIRTSSRIRMNNSRAAKWVASDALRELTSKPVQNRLHA